MRSYYSRTPPNEILEVGKGCIQLCVRASPSRSASNGAGIGGRVEWRSSQALSYLEERRDLIETLHPRARVAYHYSLAVNYKPTGDLEAAVRSGMGSLGHPARTGLPDVPHLPAAEVALTSVDAAEAVNYPVLGWREGALSPNAAR